MKAPILEKNYYSVVSAELSTGIVLTTKFERYNGKGDVFNVFKTYNSAIEFTNKKLAESLDYEFNIYDSKGEFVLTKDKTQYNKG